MRLKQRSAFICIQSDYAFQRESCYFNDLLKMTVVTKSKPENLIWMFTNNGYLNKDQMGKNKKETDKK